jgi:hypothetical protein
MKSSHWDCEVVEWLYSVFWYDEKDFNISVSANFGLPSHRQSVRFCLGGPKWLKDWKIERFLFNPPVGFFQSLRFPLDFEFGCNFEYRLLLGGASFGRIRKGRIILGRIMDLGSLDRIFKRAENNWAECCLGRNQLKWTSTRARSFRFTWAGFGHFHRDRMLFSSLQFGP